MHIKSIFKNMEEGIDREMATAGDMGGDPLSGTVERLLAPLARLCLADGLTFDKAAEMLKRSFITAAQEAQPDLPQHGAVSRLAAATGINRREVTRLLRDIPPRRPVRIPLAARIIAQWASDPAYRATDGALRPLPRQGAAPSFETLARAVTQDLHPRSALEELLRLGLVRHDQAADQICLLSPDYIPGADHVEMLTLLGDNVGDHLESAVANLAKDAIQHHDQAVFADELSQESLRAVAPVIRAHWQSLRDDLLPRLTALIQADRTAGRPQDQRLRVGLYSFSESQNEEPAR